MNYAYLYVLAFFSVFILIEVVSAIRLLSKDLPDLKRVRITMRVNLVLLVTGILMLGAAALFDVNYIFYESPIPFSRINEITFRDFRGLKRPQQTLDGNSDFAFIVTETRLSREGNRVNVSTLFHPARSYVFNSDLEDERLLKHELCHFRITEYFARMLRKEISGKPVSTATAELEALKNQYQRNEDEMQFRYDDETYHSYVLGKQLEWEKRMDSCLDLLKDHAAVSVLLK
jgi:hypothetical protein